MKTYIPENLTYLVGKTGCTKDEFGAIFGLNKSVIGHWSLNRGVPKLGTVINICSHFNVSIDDFIYKSFENLSADENFMSDCDLLKRQSQHIASLEEEVERLNSLIIKLRKKVNSSV